MFSFARFLGAAALTGCAVLAAAALSTPAEAASVVTLRACNHTDQTVLIGSSYIPIGGSDWRNKGWTSVLPAHCEDIFRTENHTFYARAEVKGELGSLLGYGHQAVRRISRSL